MAVGKGILITITAGVVIAAGVVAYATLHHASGLAVTTARVTSGPIERQVLTTGTLQPAVNIQVGSQVTGIVQSLGADFNSIVKEGQVLAKLDPSIFQAALDSAKAQLGQAQADLENAQVAVSDTKAKLVRAQALYGQQLLDQSDLQDAQVAYDTAVGNAKALAAEVTVAQAAVDSAAVNLQHTIITSPIDGIVTARDIDVGQTVTASFSAPVLFTVANNLTQLQLQATIDEADVGTVKQGRDATFTVDAYPGQTFHGELAQVRIDPLDQNGNSLPLSSAATNPAPTPGSSSTSSSTSSSSSGTPPAGTVISYTAIVNVSNPDEKLRPGMTAIIALPGPHVETAIRIPNNALSFRPSPGMPTSGTAAPTSADAHVQQVWKYDGQTLTPVIVTTGLSDDAWTELKSGAIAPGDVLVTGVRTP